MTNLIDPSKVVNIEVCTDGQYEMNGQVYSVFQRNETAYRIEYTDGTVVVYIVSKDKKLVAHFIIRSVSVPLSVLNRCRHFFLRLLRKLRILA